ncbi:DUF1361 domain-containing protein [Dellaglioa sp. BT-FLS60]
MINTTMKRGIRLFFIGYLIIIYLFIYKQQALFSFLLLNTFLGYLPIELAFHIKKDQSTLSFWLLTLLWLFFYPNAPYLLTDLFHLSLLQPYSVTTGLIRLDIHMWLNYTFLMVSALSCTLLALIGLSQIADQIKDRLHLELPYYHYVIMLGLTVLSSIGVYIGRFLRLHTVYLVTSPKWAVKMITDMWTIKMLAFVVLLTIVQLTIIICLELYRKTIK